MLDMTVDVPLMTSSAGSTCHQIKIKDLPDIRLLLPQLPCACLSQTSCLVPQRVCVVESTPLFKCTESMRGNTEARTQGAIKFEK